MAIDESRLEKLIRVKQFLLRHLLAFLIIAILSRLYFYFRDIAYEQSYSGASVAIYTFGLAGSPPFKGSYRPSLLDFEWHFKLYFILLTIGGVFWQLYFQFRLVHLLMPKPKPRSYSWRQVIMFSLILQVLGAIVLFVFWNQSPAYGESAAYYPYFYSLMVHAGGGYGEYLITGSPLLQLAVFAVFLLTAAGFWIWHDLISFKRLQFRMRWPRRTWTRPAVAGMVGVLLILTACVAGWHGLIHDAISSSGLPYSTTKPVVAYWIECVFRACALFAFDESDTLSLYNFFSLDIADFFATPTYLFIFSDIAGMPYGSPLGNGLLALTMFYLFPMVRRVFTWKDYFIAVAIFTALVIANYLIRDNTFITSSLKVFLLAARLPLTILLVTWIAIVRSKPTHSIGSPR